MLHAVASQRRSAHGAHVRTRASGIPSLAKRAVQGRLRSCQSWHAAHLSQNGYGFNFEEVSIQKTNLFTDLSSRNSILTPETTILRGKYRSTTCAIFHMQNDKVQLSLPRGASAGGREEICLPCSPTAEAGSERTRRRQ